MKLEKISHLFEKVKSGEIDESLLCIQLDNDQTMFSLSSPDHNPEFRIKIQISESGGYQDILPLYKLLFPSANVGYV